MLAFFCSCLLLYSIFSCGHCVHNYYQSSIQVAEEKQMRHLERLKSPEPAKSTCSAAHKQDQHAPKQTVRHVVKGRPKLIRDGIPATVCPSDFKPDVPNDSDSDVGKSVSELKRMFSKWGKS